MPAKLFSPRVRAALGPLALAILAAGCKEELGPERFVTTRVSGVIREGDRPVPGGWIEFLPVGGTVGNQRSARIRPDGKFAADKVPVGENALRLVDAPLEFPANSRLFGAFTTPLRRRIPEGGGDPLTIDLVDEALRFQSTIQRARERTPRDSGAGR
jgi:hypothetical protein